MSTLTSPRALLALRLIPLALALWWITDYAAGRYRIGIHTAEEQCLPWRVWFYDLKAPAAPREGYLAYRARGLEPWLADGTIIVKQLRGLPGDRLTVAGMQVAVNGNVIGELQPAVLQTIGRSLDSLQRDVVLGNDELALFGSLPGSFDARYTGPIAREQVLGRAWPLW